MDNPHFGIVIPIYNTERYLTACISSLKAQTYTNFTVVAVDDGSSDSSAHCFLNETAGDERFVLLQQANGGVASARNLALDFLAEESAKKQIDYLAYVDSDDYVSPQWLEDFASIIKKFPYDYLFCLSKLVFTDHEELSPQKAPETELNHSDCIRAFCNIPPFNFKNNSPRLLCTKIFRFPLVEKIRFDESLPASEDQHYFLRCMLNVQSGYIIPKHNYCYRRRKTSLTHTTAHYELTLQHLKNYCDKANLDSEDKQTIGNRLFEDWWQISISAWSIGNSEAKKWLLANTNKILDGFQIPSGKFKKRLFIFSLGNFFMWLLTRGKACSLKKKHMKQQKNLFE